MTNRRAEKPNAKRGSDDGLIVVPYRPVRYSSKLLPPILLVLLGTAFLAYRARSSDWRGLSLLFETRSKPAVVPDPPLPLADEPSTEAAPAQITEEPAGPVAVEGKKKKVENEQEKEKEKPTEQAQETAKPERIIDPLDDIRREAEATRERIAGLQKLKDEEARKLDENADRRVRPGLFDRRRGVVAAPERRLDAESEQLRRQLAAVAQLQVRQMRRMAEIQRGFFNDRSLAPPPPRPAFLPPPGGVARLREFQGPNGMRGFRFELVPGGLARDVPPPPKPWNGD